MSKNKRLDVTGVLADMVEGYVAISPDMLPKDDGDVTRYIAFRVRTHGKRAEMNGISANDGDYAIIDQEKKELVSGRSYAFLTEYPEELATIRRYDKGQRGQVTLTLMSLMDPRSPSVPSMFVNEKYARKVVIGEVINVMHKPIMTGTNSG